MVYSPKRADRTGTTPYKYLIDFETLIDILPVRPLSTLTAGRLRGDFAKFPHGGFRDRDCEKQPTL